ncbi:MAG TPA: hypothetical protein PKE06_13445 [Flavilitoribacter sp.]|nr:hypothetical protein [Flavilitoribacter sp.]HMQ87645.1 hypothetical protein [Flavilitoribacter sp.]
MPTLFVRVLNNGEFVNIKNSFFVLKRFSLFLSGVFPAANGALDHFFVTRVTASLIVSEHIMPAFSKDTDPGAFFYDFNY